MITTRSSFMSARNLDFEELNLTKVGIGRSLISPPMKMKLQYTPKFALGLLLLGCLAGWSVRADAPAAWGANCAACHGKDGKGNTMMGRKLSIKDLTSASFTDAQATDAIKNGVSEGGTQKMKAFGDKLSDADIAALVAYVRTLK